MKIENEKNNTEDLSPIKFNENSMIGYHAKSCPCSPMHYCLISSGNACGIPRSASVPVACFDIQASPFIDSMPIILLWLWACFLFCYNSDMRKHSWGYILSIFWKQYNSATVERLLREERLIRERSTLSALARRRLLLRRGMKESERLA